MSSVLADIWSIVRFHGRNIVRNTAQNVISCGRSVAKTVREHYRYERPLDIRTTGYVYRKKGQPEANAFRDDVLYEPTNYELLERIADLVHPRPGDVVMDFGCGKGRAVAFFATQGVRRSIGVEFRAELVEIARANARRLAARFATQPGGRIAEIEIIQGDFLTVELDEVTLFFMYNPAGEKTLKVLAARIGESLERRPRPIRLAYVYPICAQVFDDCPWLKRVELGPGEQIALWLGGPESGPGKEPHASTGSA
jgi:SAM-dependent methyltransferase